jgi:hypothetical protein
LIITQQVIENLQNPEWTFDKFDSYYDQIIGNLAWLKKDFATRQDNREKIISKFELTIKFRLEQVYENIIHIHELVSSTLINRYKKYYGPFKEELGVGTFNEMRRHIVNSFESFLTELKSLLDILVQFSRDLSSSNSSSVPTKIDSFGSLIYSFTHEKGFKHSPTVQKRGLFYEIIENKEALSECNDYRDYIIHHGNIEISLYTDNEHGNTTFSYLMPTIKKSGKKSYTKNEDKMVDLLHFSKEKLYLIIVIISNIIDKLFDDSSKQAHISALEKFDPKNLGNVLTRLGLKKIRYDRLFDETQLKEFLGSRKIKFDELVEEKRVSQRWGESKQMKKRLQGKDYSHLVTHVFYRLGKIEVMKTFSTYDRDFRPNSVERVTYAVREQGISSTDMENIENSDKILEHLRAAGLVFANESSGSHRYISTKDELDYVVNKLLHLRDYKWSFIQILEMQYFRKRTEEETEVTKEILGKSAEEHLRKEDINRDNTMAEYKKFKEEQSIPPAIVIEGKVKRFKTIIKFEQWKYEKRSRYRNWKKNLIVINPSDTNPRFKRLIPKKYFDNEFLTYAIHACKRRFSPKLHSIDIFRKSLRRDKIKYNRMIVETRSDIIDKI